MLIADRSMKGRFYAKLCFVSSVSQFLFRGAVVLCNSEDFFFKIGMYHTKANT